jgi:hypothetical protein
MAYKNFTLEDLKAKFNLQERQEKLFSNVIPVPYSVWLTETLAMSTSNPIKSEKARSEMIITPILLELKKQNNDFFTIHSGDTLDAHKAVGLSGECDFILAKNTQSFTINFPIFALIEAKRQDFELGINQCTAQMYGAWLYNQKRKQPLPFLFGCVTTADEWQFIKFENDTFLIDKDKYFINDLPTILGVFQNIINFYKSII